MDRLLIEMYQKNIAELTSWMSAPIRYLGWGLVKLLASICNGLENSVTKIYTLNNFFNSNEINEFINSYKPIIWSILAISIAVIAVKIIFNKKQNRDQLPANLIFSICVVALLPIFMVKMNDATTVVVKDLNNSTKTSANTIVKNSISDLQYLDKISYNLKGQKNNISAENILNIEINEELDTDKISSKNKDIFKKKVFVNEKGELKTEKIKSGLFGIGGDNYYRYNINSFLVVIVTLATTCITLICVSLKVARLEFELAFNKLFATLFAFADIDDGKKIREILKHIGSIFAVLISMSVMIKMYVIFSAWLGNAVSSNGIDAITKMIVLIGVSVGVIDGPNIVERIFGIDAGLKDGWKTMMGMYGAGKAAAGAGKAAVKGAKMLGKGAVVGASALAGTMGAIDGYDAQKKSMGKLSDNINKNNEKDKETSNNKPSRLNDEMKKQNSTESLNNLQSENGDENSTNSNNKLESNASKPYNSLQEEMNNNTSNSSDNLTTNKLKSGKSLDDNSQLESKTNGMKIPTLNSEMNNNVGKSDSLDMNGINSKGIDKGSSTLQDEINQSNDSLRESDIASMGNHAVDTPKLQEVMDNKSNNLSKNDVDGSKAMGTSQNGFNQSNNPIKESDIASMSNHDVDTPKLQEVMDNKENNLSGDGANSLRSMGTSEGEINQSNDSIKESDVVATSNHDVDTPKLQESMDNKANNLSEDGANGLRSMGISEGEINQSNDSIKESDVVATSNHDTNIPKLKETINDNSSDNKTIENQDKVKVLNDTDTNEGNVETRTLGQYFTQKINNNPSYNKITKAYNLGKNTGSKWAINNKKNNKEKDGSK